MAYKGKVISGDGHIDLQWLPGDLFIENAPSHLKEQMPVVKETNDGKQWFANGKPLGSWWPVRSWDSRVCGSPMSRVIPLVLTRWRSRVFFPMAQQAFFTPVPLSCGFGIKILTGLVGR